MPMYLESLDGSQAYRADLFSARKDLEHGKIYSLEELNFTDWLQTTSQKPQKKLKAIMCGEK